MKKTDDAILDLGLDEAPQSRTAPLKYHKGKVEYAGPFYTLNIAHVEHMPEFEVISVNGEVIQVERGIDVPNIPEAFVKVLRNAIASRQVTRRNKDGIQYYEWQPYPAIPFQIIEGPYHERKVPTED